MNVYRRYLVLIQRECELQLRDSNVPVLLFATPVVLLLVLGPALERFYGGGTHGATMVTLCLAVMFSFFSVSLFGWSMYRELAYGTWRRVEVLPLPNGALLPCKAIPVAAIIVAQFTTIVTVGHLFLGAAPSFGDLQRVGVVLLGVLVFQFGLSMFIASITRTSQQMFQMANLVIVVMGVVGGGLVPTWALPRIARPLGAATPQFWATQGVTGALSASNMYLTGSAVLVVFGLALGLAGIKRMQWDKLRMT